MRPSFTIRNISFSSSGLRSRAPRVTCRTRKRKRLCRRKVQLAEAAPHCLLELGESYTIYCSERAWGKALFLRSASDFFGREVMDSSVSQLRRESHCPGIALRKNEAKLHSTALRAIERPGSRQKKQNETKKTNRFFCLVFSFVCLVRLFCLSRLFVFFVSFRVVFFVSLVCFVSFIPP